MLLSLALGANDTWQSSTIKSTSPQHLEPRIDPEGGQFFWIDDAWGSTQYQRNRTEAWNQVFPIMQGAIRRGTRFLITSRDYIWREAKRELKIQALPVLGTSQVVINVQELTLEEKARILYNHLKLGDQDQGVRTIIRKSNVLPSLAKRNDFLPETARRLGTKLFTKHLSFKAESLEDFFARPKEFLEQTIEGLAAECRAAIALIFLNGGQVRSPVPTETLQSPATAFGVSSSNVREQLDALNGSLLNLIDDEEGPYWTYRHPTIADAFASYVAKSPELIEIYLRGAKPETLVQEVVCSGIMRRGALVTIPNSLHEIFADRIANLSKHSLAVFISYRSNALLSRRLMNLRPDLWNGLSHFFRPLCDDSDVDLLTSLNQQGILPEEKRVAFVSEVRSAAVEDADASFLDHDGIANTLTDQETKSILDDVRIEVLGKLDQHVERVKGSWDNDYDPDGHFDNLRTAVTAFTKALKIDIHINSARQTVERLIDTAVSSMHRDYEPTKSGAVPAQQSAPKSVDSLEELFRDVDV